MYVSDGKVHASIKSGLLQTSPYHPPDLWMTIDIALLFYTRRRLQVLPLLLLFWRWERDRERASVAANALDEHPKDLLRSTSLAKRSTMTTLSHFTSQTIPPEALNRLEWKKPSREALEFCKCIQMSEASSFRSRTNLWRRTIRCWCFLCNN